jgi:Domain of unknown function (DUF4129)
MMVAAGLLWVVLAAPPAADVERALERVRAADRYQTELPDNRAPEPRTAPRDAPARRTTPSRDRDPVDPTDLRPVGKVLLFILAGALGVALAVWIAREVRARRLARAAIASHGADPRPAAAPAVPRAPPPDHEALAARGEYGEAVHAILVLALAAIGRAGSGLPPAWTSREILAAIKLVEGPREAFAALVRAVEVTRFGGMPATEGDYRRALGWLAALVSRRAA